MIEMRWILLTVSINKAKIFSVFSVAQWMFMIAGIEDELRAALINLHTPS